MNIQRIWAIMYRHIRQTIKDVPRLSMLFYWSLIELLLVGFMGIWTQGSTTSVVALSLIAAAIGWSLIVRSCLEVSWNILEELWSHNLINLFASPLTIAEWMVSSALFSALSFMVLMLYLWVLAYAIFAYNVFSVGWLLVPLLLNYYMSAMAIGFLSSSLLIYYGIRATSYVFMVSWIFAPISGIYYGLSVLPVWVQYIAHILPTYYGIDVIKTYVVHGTIDYLSLGLTTVLNILYLVLTCILFKTCFEKSRSEGLTRLTND